MARGRIEDLLQNYRFFLMDVNPSIVPPFLAFTPELGFSGITMPEITLENEPIKDGTSPWVRKAIGKASVSQMTCYRGVRFWDNDFWDWTQNAIIGQQSPRKTLLLMHLTNLSVSALTSEGRTTAGSQPRRGDPLTWDVPSVGIPVGWGEMKLAAGRMWLLSGCVPARYKPGSDFDANNSDVSIQELSIDIESMQQINLDNSGFNEAV